MNTLIESLSIHDTAALAFFLFAWLAFDFVADHSSLRDHSLTGYMAQKRRTWMLELANREIRIVDTAIMAGLQQGCAFFCSAMLLAIGGAFSLLGSGDKVMMVYRDLPLAPQFSAALWEAKSLGLLFIFIYAFFKFAWAYRLFNYCSILIGAIPPSDSPDASRRHAAALQAADLNIIASGHFTAGLRAIFFALAYLGWFIGWAPMIASTVFVLVVLTQRQYFSRSLRVVARDADRTQEIGT